MNEKIKLLSKFPHVQKRIELFWGTVECREYLNGLTLTDTTKQGFPFDVVSVLFDLLGDHDDKFPQHIPTGSMWDATLR
jgi:hypothetical protein